MCSRNTTKATDEMREWGSKIYDPFCSDISISLWTEDAVPFLTERQTATK